MPAVARRGLGLTEVSARAYGTLHDALRGTLDTDLPAARSAPIGKDGPVWTIAAEGAVRASAVARRINVMPGTLHRVPEEIHIRHAYFFLGVNIVFVIIQGTAHTGYTASRN